MKRSFYYKLTATCRIILFPLLTAGMVFFTGCKKFLNEKPNITDVIPTKLNELQSLLDNARGAMNSRGAGTYAELISDNIYVTTANWQSFASSSNLINQAEVQNYIWSDLPHDNYWNAPYSGPVYYSNIVLDQLPLMRSNPDEYDQYNSLKGAALFYRAFSFHGLAQLYCKPFSADYANEPGIVLRTTSNVSQKTARATVQQTYDKIIADLKEAADLLPLTAVPVTRPSKTAAYAALARVYLSMGDYTNAGHYSNLALQLYNTLMDYNSLLPLSNPPVKSLNQEVIFHNYSQTYILMVTSHKIDSSLYQSYNDNDLRKTVFFLPNTGANAGTYSFRGSYNGTLFTYSVFDGLATDELYLIRAECFARAGNKDASLNDLNTLIYKRWKNNGTWVPFSATDANDALNKVLIERRKELVFRGLRWSDIRRLNLESANITLKRIIGNTTYTLLPNDPKTVMLLPFNEINNNPGILQNIR